MELTTPTSTAGVSAEVIAFDRRTADRRAAIKLLLVHEDGLARAGLRALLEREADVTVVGEVSRGDDAVAVAGELRPDIVLMGLQRSGLDAVGLAIGCVLRRRRDRVAGTRTPAASWSTGGSPKTGLPGDDNRRRGAHDWRRVSGRPPPPSPAPRARAT